MNKLNNLMKSHGEEAEQALYMEREAWFVLRAKKPSVSAHALAEKFEMEQLNDYQDRSRREINIRRGFDFGTLDAPK